MLMLASSALSYHNADATTNTLSILLGTTVYSLATVKSSKTVIEVS